MKYDKAINTLYREKENLLIIGLTGRTGAGCSTAAEILSREYEDLDFEYLNRDEWKNGDKYKFDIIKDYIRRKGKWVPFDIIEGSCVILSYVFEQKNAIDGLIEYMTGLQNKEGNETFKITDYDKLKKELSGISHLFKEINNDISKNDTFQTLKDEELERYYKIYIHKIPQLKDRLKKILQKYQCYETKEGIEKKYHLYTYLLQCIGNNIRSSGDPYKHELKQEDYYSLAKKIEKLIELIRIYNRKVKKKPQTRICIDAIRNVNESNYLKDKYRAYYLISISADEAARKERLNTLNANEQKSIDDVENAVNCGLEEFFYHQNIAKCFEMADIHLYNENVNVPERFFLTWQLVKYVTLMIHPGIITPTHLERCMQLAFNAKYNSGCLSRQVGAIITDNNFSVKAVGWNDVPKGQLPCNLRNVTTYCKGNHSECFSQFEVEDERFRQAVNDIKYTLEQQGFGDANFPFCFKDIHNGYTDGKNQVFTRALHAEENAFLQITKNGGQGIKDGFLFVTASPCELCSKKSYQLGIKNIYYIDPYPGIAEKHILQFGSGADRPKSNLFYGAIGEAYIALYRPLLPFKDELEMISGVDCKKVAKNGRENICHEFQAEDLHYNRIDFQVSFKTRNTIECKRSVKFKVMKGSFSSMERYIAWTGSSYDGTELVGEEYKIEDYNSENTPYQYRIDFGHEIKENEEISYTVCSKLSDENESMKPYIAHYVEHPTDELVLRIEVPKENSFMNGVIYKRYADKDMTIEYDDILESRPKIDEEDEGDVYTYSIRIKKPNLFYTYSLRWNFI